MIRTNVNETNVTHPGGQARGTPPDPAAGLATGPARAGPSNTPAHRGSVPEHTGSQATKILGLAALASSVLWALYGLVWSPPEVDMGDVVRLLYVHVPAATLLYIACALTTVSSAMWLRRRSSGWDALALSAAELAAIFGALTLLTGSIWGRPTWGTYWTWDPRLTTTALLQVLIIGYLALRRVEPSGGVAGFTPAAILGLLLLPNVVIVRYSVDWWRSLHQGATLNTLTPTIEGDMLVSLMLGLLTGGLVFVWLLTHRFRVAYLEQQVEAHDLDAAIAARRAELHPPIGDVAGTEARSTKASNAGVQSS